MQRTEHPTDVFGPDGVRIVHMVNKGLRPVQGNEGFKKVVEFESDAVVSVVF